jgi:hypothetical protein
MRLLGINTYKALAMRTIAQRIYLDARPGLLEDLPRAGSPLEHPLVFDATAHELKEMAQRGLLVIVEEGRTDGLIDHLRFRRVA